MISMEIMRKPWIGLIGVLVLGMAMGYVLRFGGPPVAGPEVSPPGIPSGGEPSASSSEEMGGAEPAKAPVPAGKPPVSTLKFLTPAGGDRWAMGSLHDIVWSREAGAVGSILLFRASTKERVGWILPSTGPKQVSYQWDTRDIALTRVGGTRQNVAAGEYYVRLAFDDGRSAVQSEPFALAGSGPETVTYTVRLRNVSITPKVLTVKRGAKVVFVNNDPVKQIVSPPSGLSTFVPFTIPAGGTHIFDTGALQPGTYNYRSDIYTYQAPGTLIVE